jgi:hypothetical protein
LLLTFTSTLGGKTWNLPLDWSPTRSFIPVGSRLNNYDKATITAVKSFIIFDPGGNVIINQGTLTEGEGSEQLTSLNLLAEISSFYYCIFSFFTKQAISMWRSTVLSLSLE